MAGRSGNLSRVLCVLSLAAIMPIGPAHGEDAAFHDQAIFPAENKHNHASCVIETARGDLLAAWYSGTGERDADDVVIQGAWLARGRGPGDRDSCWPIPRDTPTATPRFAAPDGSVWLFWPTILDHRWEGALLKYAVAECHPGSSRAGQVVAVRDAPP